MSKMKKLNNKGFSLVELIIVIAIMAILVGIVGTQVIPYLENSRKAKDQQIISSWNTAAMSAYSNAAAKVDATQDYTITLSFTDSATTIAMTPASGSDAGSQSIENYFKELTGIASFVRTSCESKAGKNINSVTIKIESNGKISTVTTCGGGYNFDPIYNN
jgi:prepilin-type N-terminal cleavage/methylation domain-containing protein